MGKVCSWKNWDRFVQILTIAAFILSYLAFDIANNQLKKVEADVKEMESRIEGIDKHFVFLRTLTCERFWFFNNGTDRWASCLNSSTSAWTSCFDSNITISSRCEDKEWFKEIKETESWKLTLGTW